VRLFDTSYFSVNIGINCSGMTNENREHVVNKADLVEKVANQTGLTKKTSREAEV